VLSEERNDVAPETASPDVPAPVPYNQSSKDVPDFVTGRPSSSALKRDVSSSCSPPPSAKGSAVRHAAIAAALASKNHQGAKPTLRKLQTSPPSAKGSAARYTAIYSALEALSLEDPDGSFSENSLGKM